MEGKHHQKKPCGHCLSFHDKLSICSTASIVKSYCNKMNTANIKTRYRSAEISSICIRANSVVMFVLLCTAALVPQVSGAFQSSLFPPSERSVRTVVFESFDSTVVEPQSPVAKEENEEVKRLKSDLIQLADRTNRGFTASAGDKRRAKEILESLQRFQTVLEPAKSYYDTSATSAVSPGEIQDSSSSTSTISGKWTLIYTDAPDITGLDTSRNPFSTAKLGRIGQECEPPYIKNVIEWLRPDWAANLPLSGKDNSRILQKVVTSGSATPAKPTFVELKVAGLELKAGECETNSNGVLESVQNQGLPAGFLSMNPVDLKGPLNPPFGRFEILYLDDDLRAIRTSQNFLAVNRRIVNKEEEWF